MRNYIIKDLVIWFSLLILLPIAIFVLYYIAADNDKPRENDDLRFTLLNKFQHRQQQQQGMELMKKVQLSEALCNDGSQATYYIKTSSSGSSMWVIVLEGGYFCYDRESCRTRAINSANLTSSKEAKKFRRGRGILASRPDENPFWHDANLVVVPYCSSDLWIGNKKQQPQQQQQQQQPNKPTSRRQNRSRKVSSDQNQDFHFMGHRILNDVLDDLLNSYSMSEAKSIVLVGQSAGGIGVLMNANRIRTRLAHEAPHAQLKAVVDSAWLLELPYSFLCNHLPTDECFMNKLFSNSINYWNAQLPDECLIDEENKWDCFLPYKILPLINVPVFVVQSIFDETLVIEHFSNVPTILTFQPPKPEIQESLKFFTTLRDVRARMLDTLRQASNTTSNVEFFIPSCTIHTMLTRPEFSSFRIGTTFLSSALDSWTRELHNNQTLLIDEQCKWPDCQQTCPDLKHPDTSRSVDLIEYFSYFGLVNYRQVADLLEISESDVRRMGYVKFMSLIMPKLII